MPTIRFRKDDIQFFSTPVDNLFIDEFMGRAPGEFVKVYLFGLRLCLYPPENGLDLTTIARQLDLPEDMVGNAFSYWERQGLVKVTSRNPLSVEYLEIQQQFQRGAMSESIYPYRDLNAHLQKLFGERLLTHEEFSTVYDWIEVLGLPQQVIPLLAQHCIDKAGKRVSFSYLDKTARTWAEKKLTTIAEAEDYLMRYEETYGGARRILKRWNLDRPPTEDEVELYRKWVRVWGMEPGAINEVLSRMTGYQKHSFKLLDSLLSGLYEQNALTARQAVEVLDSQKDIRNRLRRLIRELGASDSADTPELQSMYRRWIENGFSDEAIVRAARQLSQEGRHQMSDLASVLSRWSQWGMVSDKAIEGYLDRIEMAAEAMNELIAAWGENRAATGSEKKAYLDMLDAGFSPMMIALAAEFAQGARNRIPYMRKLLEVWREKGIDTPEAARADRQRYGGPAAGGYAVHFDNERAYTDEELAERFVDFGEV